MAKFNTMQNNVRVEQLEHTVRILVDFSRNTHLKRVLHSVDSSPPLNFWRIIYGNLLDMAVIEWCKLFGSDHEERQPVHWKNVVPTDSHEQFRNDLFKKLKITQDQWNKYWEEVKGYRDNHAAHFNVEWIQVENDPRYPNLDIAFQTACFYYTYLMDQFDILGVNHNLPKDIGGYCERFSTQAKEIAIKALNATKGIEEKID